MSTFERYLTVWVALCIILGIALGQFFPSVFHVIGTAEIAKVNLPVAVLIWLMIIPMLVKIDFAALSQVKDHWRGIGVTLFINWAVKPFSMALLGWLFVGWLFKPYLPADQINSYIAGAGDEAVLAQGAETVRAQLSEALDELREAAQLAVVAGHSGVTTVDDHLAPLMLRRSPRLAARLDARALREVCRGAEVVRTLDTLMAHDFDRARTAAALPVHRNTLTNRLNRIAAITELDVDSADGRGLLWLAWLGRR